MFIAGGLLDCYGGKADLGVYVAGITEGTYRDLTHHPRGGKDIGWDDLESASTPRALLSGELLFIGHSSVNRRRDLLLPATHLCRVQCAIILELELIQIKVKKRIVGYAVSLVDRSAGSDMSIVIRLARGQAVVSEEEANPTHKLTRADVASGVEVVHSPWLSIQRLSS